MNDLAFIALLLTVDSLHFVFARLLLPNIDHSISPMYVMAIATLEIGIYGFATKKLKLSGLGKRIWVFLAIGGLIAGSMMINYGAVAYIDPGTASLLTQTGTIWGLLLGVFWLKDKLRTKQIWGALIAILGVLIITYQTGDYLRLGSFMVLASAFMYALHAAIAKRYGDEMDLLNFFFYRVLFILLFLMAFAGASGQLAWPKGIAWVFLFLTGTVDVVISRLLYYFTLRRLSLSLLTIILTLSPVVTILWALALFQEVPNGQQMLGGAAVLAGVLIVSLNRSKQAAQS
jgi:drug/metabolite transporter (DMT)-like permease